MSCGQLRSRPEQVRAQVVASDFPASRLLDLAYALSRDAVLASHPMADGSLRQPESLCKLILAGVFKISF